MGVIAGAAGLAGVVHEQREQKQVEAVDFGQEPGETLFPLVMRLAEGVDVIDDEEGVLVDGVAMVGVADDERVDAMEFGDEQLEDSEGVHGAQSMGGVGADQNFAQAVP